MLYEGDNGYVAIVAEVEVDQTTGVITVRRLVGAQDCGPISNPDGVKNQFEGGALHGMSRALFEEVTWNDQAVTSDDWRTYRTFAVGTRTPVVETVLVNQPSAEANGAGETAITAVAAAIGNAVFDATGARLREIPFTPDRVKAALAAARRQRPASAGAGRLRQPTCRGGRGSPAGRRRAKPQSALALRATSARVQRGRINPGAGVGRAPHQEVADLVRHRAAEQRAEVAVGPARQPLHAIDVDRGEHAGARGRIDQRRAQRLVARRPASLGDRTSRTISSPRPSGTVQRPPLDAEHDSHVTSRSAGRSVCAAASSAVRSAAFGTSALS